MLAGQTLIPILSQIELKFNAEQAHYTMCWISNERKGGRGSVAKHSHKLQAADQTQANSTAAGKKLSWFSQDLAKNSQLLKKVTISHPDHVCRFLSSFWTLRVLRLKKFHNIEYNTNINHVCLLFYAHHTFMFLSVLVYTRYTTHLNLLFSDSLWSSLQSLQYWSLFVYVFSVVFVGCLFVYV